MVGQDRAGDKGRHHCFDCLSACGKLSEFRQVLARLDLPVLEESE